MKIMNLSRFLANSLKRDSYSKNSLNWINSNFWSKLSLNLKSEGSILDEARDKLPTIYQAKLAASLAKNPDLESIFAIESHLAAANYHFAPLCSVDVERSFSQLKNILT